MSIVVRGAVVADGLEVAGLYVQLAPDPGAAPPCLSAEELRTWREMLANESVTVVVAEIDRSLVGTACLMLMPSLLDDCTPTGFIENMVVDARHRRAGVGRALIDHLVGVARISRCRRLQLLSHKDRAAEVHVFYRAMGFDSEAEGFRRYL